MAYTNAQMLDMLDTAIEALLTGKLQSYTIANRSYTKLDLDVLMKSRDHYAQKVTNAEPMEQRVVEF
ncbi:MAG: hypothetical protein JRD89_10970 [Deltaproteobacteria bacterium]|nr:hypothetical protein [Deltaproteobacteria bacterium]